MAGQREGAACKPCLRYRCISRSCSNNVFNLASKGRGEGSLLGAQNHGGMHVPSSIAQIRVGESVGVGQWVPALSHTEPASVHLTNGGTTFHSTPQASQREAVSSSPCLTRAKSSFLHPGKEACLSGPTTQGLSAVNPDSPNPNPILMVTMTCSTVLFIHLYKTLTQ